MHDLIELIRALAWPVTTLAIIFILRNELQRFTQNVAERIRSANSISIGPRGFELKGLVKVAPLPPEVQARKVAVARFVRASTNKSMLDSIAAVLAVPQSTDLRTQKNDIIREFNRRVEAPQDMDELATAFKAMTGRDF